MCCQPELSFPPLTLSLKVKMPTSLLRTPTGEDKASGEGLTCGGNGRLHLFHLFGRKEPADGHLLFPCSQRAHTPLPPPPRGPQSKAPVYKYSDNAAMLGMPVTALPGFPSAFPCNTTGLSPSLPLPPSLPSSLFILIGVKQFPAKGHP